MEKKYIKKSIFAKIRNNFIAGVVVLIPIGITLYLTLFFIRISGKIVPKEIFTIVKSCLHENPKKRPQNVIELKNLLKNHI